MAEKERKAYCRPEVKKVKLTPEEAVLASCKVTGAPLGGPGWPACVNSLGQNCISIGS
jgi:hypothetical protein